MRKRKVDEKRKECDTGFAPIQMKICENRLLYRKWKFDVLCHSRNGLQEPSRIDVLLCVYEKSLRFLFFFTT